MLRLLRNSKIIPLIFLIFITCAGTIKEADVRYFNVYDIKDAERIVKLLDLSVISIDTVKEINEKQYYIFHYKKK